MPLFSWDCIEELVVYLEHVNAAIFSLASPAAFFAALKLQSEIAFAEHVAVHRKRLHLGGGGTRACPSYGVPTAPLAQLLVRGTPTASKKKIHLNE